MDLPLTPGLRVRGLSKKYGSVAAVRDVSLDAMAGEIFGLLGPNGAGKTTTLECILGLRDADAGSIWIAGVETGADPQAARKGCGAQIQCATLQDKITPRKALGLFASFYERPAGVSDLIDKFGLGSRADTAFDSLSAGQRQRLFLAMAFINEPSVVILDEPTAGLDPLARRELHGIIREFRGSGRTVVLSTHDMAEAQALCDRIAILDEGRIVASAKTEDLLAGQAMQASLQFRTRAPLARLQILALPGAKGCQAIDGGWVVATSAVNETLAALAIVLRESGNELLELQVVRPTLEDAFLSITGRRWKPMEGTP